MNYDDAEGDNQFFIMKRVKTYYVLNPPIFDERVGHVRS